MRVLGPDGVVLDTLDLLLVRGLPRGSLEQVIFRMDALHVLAGSTACACVNGPRAIERTIDKSWAGAVLAGAGRADPADDRLRALRATRSQAFDRLGGDVVVKPLFGAMGNGIVRVEDRDVAHRVFRALELERAVYYVQRTIAPTGRRDLRALVVARRDRRRDGAGDRLVARQRRPRGARPCAVTLGEQEREPGAGRRRRASRPTSPASTCWSRDGQIHVLEVNGIPGWQALQSVCEDDLTARVVAACEALVAA